MPSSHTEERPIDLFKIGAIVEKNFIVMTRDKIRLIPLLIFPIIMILVLGFVSGNSPKHIAAVIVVQDESPLSQTIQQDIAGSQYFSVANVVSTEGEARRLLDSGKVRVIVEIPPGLQDDVDAGIRSGITVIVDESDSSVGATSKQVLSSIMATVSGQTSLAKFQGYQQSVQLAGSRMAAYAGAPIDQYPAIQAQTIVSEDALIATKAQVDREVASLLFSPPAPAPVVIEYNTSVPYHSEEIVVVNGTTFAAKSLQADSWEAQLGTLGQLSASVGGAAAHVSAANTLAEAAGLKMAAIKAAYQSQVARSLDAIEVFTQTDPTQTLQPLTYKEKPAYGTGKKVIDFLIPSLIAMTIFQGALMGMGRAVAGEKRDGSLSRVFLTPTSNTTIIIGTLLFYVLFELVRAALLIAFSIIAFGVTIEGNVLTMVLILTVYITICAALGMLISSLVRTEQQFMAVAMLFSLPTMFLSGAFFPVQAMPGFMQAIARFLPVTYAGDALRTIMVKGLPFSYTLYPLGILMVFLIIIIGILMKVFKRDVE